MSEASSHNTPTPDSPASSDGGPAFFRRVDWSAFWVCFLVTFAVYFYTLAPTVTLEDSGELVVASDYLGVPHPPGYPSWTLITWFFQWIFHWVKYNGHPNPAWSVGLMSAFFGALTCGLTSLLISRSGMAMLRSHQRVTTTLGEKAESTICWAGAVTAGLLLAFSPGLWSQSVIVEVYSLNTFFLVMILLMLYRWYSRPREPVYLWVMAFLFGLGLTNHQTLMFVGLALAAAVLFRDVHLFRDFVTLGLFFVGLLLFNIFAGKVLGNPSLMWKAGPAHLSFWIQTLLAIAVPTAAIFVLPRGREVGPTYLLALLGLSFYFYLPFASEQNPPMNWAYPRTWEGFLHSITRGQYEKVTLSNILADPAMFASQLGAYFRDLRMQYSLPIALVGFLPFTAWSLSLRGRRINMFFIAAALIIPITLFAFLLKLVTDPTADIAGAGSHPLESLYKILSALLISIGIVGVIEYLFGYFEQEIRRKGFAGGLALFLLGLVGALIAFLDIRFIGFLVSGEAVSSTNRLIYALLIVLPPLAIAAMWWLKRGPAQLRGELDPLAQRWMLVSIAAFIALSIVLVIFLNPKLDIQTLFIQRVQLIQSHAVFAIWIGFGLLLSLAFFETRFGGGRAVRIAGFSAVILLPLISLGINAFDEERIRIVGGAEQRGHDYGWQFGYWQLRGANGINEELDPEEPPLPNPEYPPEMTTNAIFFGGTDPGRFVPTYMIYSAHVRPDVYLITQNALADNTYMNVMRDLYGDEIYIPSQQDSNAAFQKYVDDVRAGRIQAGADVNIDGGRVSVQGVQGVMAINGILARNIFDYNKHKHDFYVEESYVIPWMYPYLEPHGLIMKINKEPTPLTDAVIKNDRDFWDWYTRRLLSDNGFLRDIVARKTFSKLRSALAGLYSNRRKLAEAEHAFLQAIELYPLSPEANFRLADLYMQQRRYDDAIDIILALSQGDPGNDKVTSFLNQIRQFKDINQRRTELEAVLQEGSSDLNQAFELAQIYLRMGMNPQFQSLTTQILNQPNLPPQTILQIGQLYSQAKRMDLLENALQRYLQAQPNDATRWIDLAAVRLSRQKGNQALQALQRAIQLDGASARDAIRRDTRFQALRNVPQYQQLVPPAKTLNNSTLTIPGF